MEHRDSTIYAEQTDGISNEHFPSQHANSKYKINLSETGQSQIS